MLHNPLFKYFGKFFPIPSADNWLECFFLDGFEYIKTSTGYYRSHVDSSLCARIKKSDFDYYKSIFNTRINQSQAKGLQKLTQLVFDL